MCITDGVDRLIVMNSFWCDWIRTRDRIEYDRRPPPNWWDPFVTESKWLALFEASLRFCSEPLTWHRFELMIAMRFSQLQIIDSSRSARCWLQKRCWQVNQVIKWIYKMLAGSFNIKWNWIGNTGMACTVPVIVESSRLIFFLFGLSWGCVWQWTVTEIDLTGGSWLAARRCVDSTVEVSI